MKARKYSLFVGIITVLSMVLVGVLTGCVKEEETPYGAEDPLSKWIVEMEDPDPVIELKDVHIPSGMREKGIGLFWLSPKGQNDVNYLKSTSEEGRAAFDPEKPTMIFFHGMQMNTGATAEEGFSLGRYWLDAGYNAAIFYWSQLADELLPMTIEGKIWGAEMEADTGKQNVMNWKNSDRLQSQDKPNVSVTEIFVAYYMDFMKNVDYRGSEIRFTGLSLGGQMALATSSYLATKEIQGLLETKYLPDRVAIFDPYIMGATLFCNNTYVPWLKRNMFLPTGKEDNSQTTGADLMGEICGMLKNRGIAVEYVPSVSGIVPGLMGDESTDAKKMFYKNCITLDFRTDYATDIDQFNEFHLAGREWYCKTMAAEHMMDTAMQNSLEFALGARTPTPYTYLRSGVTYRMNENQTVDPGDDTIFSVNIAHAQVGGFAFIDANDDGVYNDRIQSRLAGVKVELYLKNGTKTSLVASAITDHTGAYLLNIDDVYANGFDQFYLKVYAPKGYAIGKTADAAALGLEKGMVSELRSDGQSEEFTLAHTKALKVLNLGFVKK